MDILHTISDWFWDPDIWLIPGISWDDLKSTPENGYPNSADLFPMALAITLVLFIVRYLILEPLIVKPFGRVIGLKEQTSKLPVCCEELEELFLLYQKSLISENQIVKVAKGIGWSGRQVERWLRRRLHAEKASKMFRFCDCSWNLTYYIFFCIFGIYILKDKPWLWDIKLCWVNYPFQAVPSDIWWYYMISLGYYTNMSLTFMIQHKRKDSLQMLLHHLVTILMIVLSFCVNMLRVGSLILVVHEVADIPLLLAKICGYAGANKVKEFLFIVFVLLWVATRLFLYPFWIMRSALFEVHVILNAMAPLYYIFNILLVILFSFHIVWTFMIIKIIARNIKTRKVKDVRSDSGESSSELEDTLSQPYENHLKKA